MDQLARHFIEDEPRRRVGHLRDVSVAVTRGWWLPPALTLGAGQLLGRVRGRADHPVRRGLGYSAAIGAASAVHALGHIQTARMVEAPMDTLLLTPIRLYTLYDDTGKTITRDQDIGRAIGGPAANVSIGMGALLLSLVLKNRYLRFFGVASTLFGLAALIPAAGNDGEELFRPKTTPT
jgi:predicted MFS family arabinose efflux permease